MYFKLEARTVGINRRLNFLCVGHFLCVNKGVERRFIILNIGIHFFPVALRPDSRSWPRLTGHRVHTLDTLQSVGLLWTSDQPDADIIYI